MTTKQKRQLKILLKISLYSIIGLSLLGVFIFILILNQISIGVYSLIIAYSSTIISMLFPLLIINLVLFAYSITSLIEYKQKIISWRQYNKIQKVISQIKSKDYFKAVVTLKDVKNQIVYSYFFGLCNGYIFNLDDMNLDGYKEYKKQVNLILDSFQEKFNPKNIKL